MNPPKSDATLRNALHAVRSSTAREHQAGGHRSGLAGDFPISVASFHERSVANQFQDLLAEHRIYSQIKKKHKVWHVIVDREDQPIASRLYVENKNAFPNRVHASASLRFDYLIFGIVIGITLGAIALLVLWPEVKAFSAASAFIAICGLTGHLMDRIRVRQLRTGKAMLGLWELLILTTIPCLMYLVCQIGFSMIKP